MKKLWHHYELGFAARLIVGMIVALVLGLGAASALADPGNGNGPPATVPGSPGDDCSHGNSNQACKPDPQPEHGKDCDDHGNARGNEDHCDAATTPDPTTPDPTTPDETTPTDTTPTTPEVTTSTPSDATVPGTTTGSATPGPVTTPAPSTPTTAAPSSSATSAKSKAKPKAAATKVVRVQKQAHGVVVVTTADGRKHVGIMGSG